MSERARTEGRPFDAPRAFALRRLLGEESGWLAVTALATAVEVACWTVGWICGAAPAPFFLAYFALAFAGLATAAAARRALRPRAARASWPSLVCGTGLAAIAASLMLPLKYAIPRTVPFWLDAPIASAERALFGADPWQLLDRALGWATAPIDWLYGLWLPAQLLVLFAVMLEPPSRAKSRALMAYSLAWVLLGVVAATIFSSAGPIFHDRLLGGEAFAALHETLRQRGAWLVLAEFDRMWRSLATGSPGFVAGISAVPSIHVAISVWIVLTARAMAPRLVPVASLYAGLIWIGSVQLGWHYVSDGAAGALGMLPIWAMAGALHRALGRAAAPRS